MFGQLKHRLAPNSARRDSFNRTSTYPTPETASDNAFQREVTTADAETISQAAQKEFDQAVDLLRGAGVTVHVFDDTASPEKPDAVFPNNWFSTHPDGRVALYPMYSPTRRDERRRDVIDELGKSIESPR